MAERYRLVECPGYTAIEDTVLNERLVTIHTKRAAGEYLTADALARRKELVLEIFNSWAKAEGESS